MFKNFFSRYTESAPQSNDLGEANRMLRIVWEERNEMWAGRDILKAVVVLQFVLFLAILVL